MGVGELNVVFRSNTVSPIDQSTVESADQRSRIHTHKYIRRQSIITTAK